MRVGTVMTPVDDPESWNPAVKTGDSAEFDKFLGLNAVQSVKFVNWMPIVAGFEEDIKLGLKKLQNEEPAPRPAIPDIVKLFGLLTESTVAS